MSNVNHNQDPISALEVKIVELLNSELGKSIPLVSVSGLLNLLSQDLINQASMARMLLNQGESNE